MFLIPRQQLCVTWFIQYFPLFEAGIMLPLPREVRLGFHMPRQLECHSYLHNEWPTGSGQYSNPDHGNMKWCSVRLMSLATFCHSPHTHPVYTITTINRILNIDINNSWSSLLSTYLSNHLPRDWNLKTVCWWDTMILKSVFQEADDCLSLYLKLRSSNFSWELPKLLLSAQYLERTYPTDL